VRQALAAVAVLAALCAGACQKNQPSTGAAPAASASAAASAAAAAAEQERARKAEQAAALDKATAAAKDFSAAASDDKPDKYIAFLSSLRDAQRAGADVSSMSGAYSPQTEALASEYKSLVEADSAATSSDVPEKPVYEPPKYDGAYYLAGSVRTCYKDGVLLAANGKYYFVKDADCPQFSLLHGWVEETGATVTADIGRDGRDAIVVEIADREKAQDDRKAHAEEVKKYKAEYAENMAAYQKAFAENRDAITAAQKAKAQRAKRKAVLTKLLEPLLTDAATKLGSGQATGPSAIALAVADASAAPPAAAQSVGSATEANPAQDKASAVGGPAKPQMDRQTCLRACVAGCHDDADCERRCLSSPCSGAVASNGAPPGPAQVRTTAGGGATPAPPPYISPVPQPPPPFNPGPAPVGVVFDRGAAATALGAIGDSVSSCKKPGGPTGEGHVSVTFSPSGGVMSAVVDQPPFAGTGVGGCIAAKFRAAHVPPFAGGATTIGKRFSIN